MHHFELQRWGVGEEKHFFLSPFKEGYYPYLRVKVRTAAGQETFAHRHTGVGHGRGTADAHTAVSEGGPRLRSILRCGISILIG